MSDDNKEAIGRIALELFSRKGYEGVGVQEVCDVAGITKPTLYHYFKSKRGLLENIMKDYGERLYSVILEALVYKHDFIKSLTEILKTEIDFACKNPDFFNFHYILLHSPAGSEQQEIYMSLIQKIMDAYGKFFELSCNEFGNMRGKERLYSVLFHDKVVSVAFMCANGQLVADDEIVFQIIHSVVYGIAN